MGDWGPGVFRPQSFGELRYGSDRLEGVFSATLQMSAYTFAKNDVPGGCGMNLILYPYIVFSG